MVFPLIIAKCAPGSSVIELTTNALEEILAPAFSTLEVEILAVGFHPIGQKGLRASASSLKAERCFSSIFGVSSANTGAPQTKRQMNKIFFISFQWPLAQSWRPAEIPDLRYRRGYATESLTAKARNFPTPQGPGRACQNRPGASR